MIVVLMDVVLGHLRKRAGRVIQARVAVAMRQAPIDAPRR